MKNVYNTFRPTGCCSVNPYLFVADPEAYIEFLEKALYAEETGRTSDPKTGDIQNAQIAIGHSRIMLSQAKGQFEGMKTSMYLYVDDVDAVYNNALQHGAESEFAPEDMTYGDRQAGIKDPEGNYWWISKRLNTDEYY